MDTWKYCTYSLHEICNEEIIILRLPTLFTIVTIPFTFRVNCFTTLGFFCYVTQHIISQGAVAVVLYLSMVEFNCKRELHFTRDCNTTMEPAWSKCSLTSNARGGLHREYFSTARISNIYLIVALEQQLVGFISSEFSSFSSPYYLVSRTLHRFVRWCNDDKRSTFNAENAGNDFFLCYISTATFTFVQYVLH